jgi:hypothetical protein
VFSLSFGFVALVEFIHFVILILVLSKGMGVVEVIAMSLMCVISVSSLYPVSNCVWWVPVTTGEYLLINARNTYTDFVLNSSMFFLNIHSSCCCI